MAALADYKLFTPLQIDDTLVLKNRVVVAPTTRARADIETHAPVERMNVYYEQRAGAGLIITEGTLVSEQGFGWYGAPALYTQEHADAWKTVVDRVHAKDGKIFVQLWHMGRQSHSSFNAKREVVAASAVPYVGGVTRDASGEPATFETPRALEASEIAAVVDDFRTSALLAERAGFDGVEVMACNGYLLDNFLQSSTNMRTDAYGGSFENRYRFLHEVVEAVKTVYPASRIGVRLSPNGAFGGMGSADNYDMFTYAFARLGEHGLAYLSLLDGVGFGFAGTSRLVTLLDAKTRFKGLVMANSSLTRDVAEGVLRSGAADFCAFGRLYMASPDLAERFRNDWPLNPEVERDCFWDAHKGDDGYNFPLYTKAE